MRVAPRDAGALCAPALALLLLVATLGVSGTPLPFSVYLTSTYYSTGESLGHARISVMRSGDFSAPANVTLNATSGTADVPGDVTQSQVVAYFPPYFNYAEVTLAVARDGLDEGTESFQVTLYDAGGGSFGTPTSALVALHDTMRPSAALHPALGPSHGGTVVIVEGENFHNGSRYECNFNNETAAVSIRAAAVFLSSTELACVSTACASCSAGPGSLVNVDIRERLAWESEEDAWQPWTHAGVFDFYARPVPRAPLSALDVVPQYATAGSTITVQLPAGLDGRNSSELALRIGRFVVDAFAASSLTSLTAQLPEGLEPGPHPVAVSFNGVDFESTSPAATVNVLGAPRVLSLSPTAGLVTGGTLIEIKGENLLAGATCVFDDATAVAGTWVDFETVRCRSPASISAESVTVEVQNPATAEPTANGVIFTFLISHDVFEVTPKSGTHGGGTLVTVLGSGFINVPSSRCSFSRSAPPVIEETSAATFLTATAVICTSPNLDAAGVAPNALGLPVQVDFSNNGLEFSEDSSANAEFRFFPPPQVTAVHPKNGPASGGTVVEVMGTGLISTGSSKVRCRFGAEQPVVAQTLSPTLVLCETPAIATPGPLAVEVSGNDVDFSANAVQFNAHAPVRVTALTPTLGPYSLSVPITLHGTGFFDPSPAHAVEVRFDNLAPIAATSFTPTEIIFPATGIAAAQYVVEASFNSMIDVSKGGNTYTGLAVATVDPAPTPAVFHPVAPAGRDVAASEFVAVTGTDFLNVDTFRCRWSWPATADGDPAGHVDTTASVYPPGDADCRVPAPGTVPWGAEVSISVSANAVHFTATSAAARPHEGPRVTAVSPRAGSSIGGTAVTVHGSRMTVPGFERPSCYFGDRAAVVPAIEVTETSAVCMAPGPRDDGPAAVYYSVNGADFATGEPGTAEEEATIFSFAGHPVVSEISVDRVTTAGATAVTLRGSGFRADNATRGIGARVLVETATGVAATGAPVPAASVSYVSDTEIVATMPATGLADVGSAPLLVSNTLGVEHIATGFALRIGPRPGLVGFGPVSGPRTGGTRVTIAGSDFASDPRLTCEFSFAGPAGSAAQTAPAEFSASSAVVCTVPADPAGPGAQQSSSVNITVAATAADLAVPEGSGRAAVTVTVPFAYHNNIGVDSARPALAHPAGGSFVTVAGSNFSSPSSVVCHFGSRARASAANVTSESEIVCVAPPLPAGAALGPVELRVSLNGGHDLSETSAPFSYAAAPAVSRISPVEGPVSGGTVVDLRGSGFLASATVCLFGGSPASGGGGGVGGGGGARAAATFVSATKVLCTAPPSPAGAGRVPVEVSVDGNVTFTANSMHFEFYPAATVTAVHPPRATTVAGVDVTVHGTNFRAGARTQCSFGGTHPLRPATALAGGAAIVCASPAPGAGVGAAGLVSVAVTNNDGADLSGSSVPFELYEPPVVSAVDPPRGPEQGGTDVRVLGSGFTDETGTGGPGVTMMLCRFGELAVAATFVSATELRCAAPPRHGRLSGDTAVEVAVSLAAGADYSASPAGPAVAPSYLYYEAPSVAAVRHLGVDLRVVTDGGGLTVTVVGTHFRTGAGEAAHTLFRFSGNATLVAAATATADLGGAAGATSAEVVVPEMSAAAHGIIEVEVSNNGGADWSADRTAMLVVPEPAVTAVSPGKGDVSGGTVARVYGSHFLQSRRTLCRFGPGAPAVAASWVSPTIVSCAAPAGSYSGSPVAVDVTVNGGAEYSSSVVGSGGGEFTYLLPATITAVSPTKGSTRGGSLVRVFGTNFVWGDMACRFGLAAPVPARFISATVAECPSPVGVIGSVPVEITVNDNDYTSGSGVSFEYITPPSVVSLSPTSGPYSGGTLVTIVGFNFDPGFTWVRFGDLGTSVLVPAGNFNGTATTFTIESPAYAAGSHPVEVSSNDVDFSETGVRFTYVGSPIPYVANPDHGSVGGGTGVTISGTNFIGTAGLSCRFAGAHVVPARFLGPFELVCVTPPLPTGNHTIELSLNGTDSASWTTGEADSGYVVRFFAEHPAEVTSVSPSAGPMAGGTVVTVHGSSFRQTELDYDLTCAFGSARVPGTAVGSGNSTVLCVSPRVYDAGSVAIEVSNNGGADFTSDAVAFEYFPQVIVAERTPPQGPASGGTVVTVVGANFESGAGLRCRFGTEPDVPATRESATKLTCTSPAIDPVPAGAVPLEVTSNAADFSDSGVPFLYYAVPNATAVHPPRGHGFAETAVTVYGTGFLPTTLLRCRFGAHPASTGPNADTVPAAYLSPTSVSCRTPLRAGASLGPAPVEVSCNAADFTTAGLAVFEFDAGVEVSAVFPAAALLTGGTTLTVEGHNFTGPGSAGNSLCRFTGGYVTPAVRLSAVHATCASPNLPPSTEPGTIFAEVSFNGGEDWSTGEARLHVYRPAQVSSLSPRIGGVGGGLSVTVAGNGFVNATAVGANMTTCQFGAEPPSAGQYLTETSMVCVSPAVSTVGAVALEVSFNGFEYTQSLVSFLYAGSLNLTSFEPQRGPVSGGTSLTVTGTGFLNLPTLQCRFGSSNALRVRALFHDSRRIVCVAPAAAAGAKVVEASNNGRDWIAAVQGSFTYQATRTITSVAPSRGPLRGTTVTVAGSNFVASSDFTVSFGRLGSGACSVSSTSVAVCATPGALEPGTVDVEVSNNAVDFTADAAVTFQYDAPVTVSSLSPDSGPPAGGNTVTVHGAGIVDTSGAGDLLCVFNGTVTVAAAYAGPTEVSCPVPAADAAAPDGYVTVEVTVNGIAADASASSVRYQYIEPESFSHLSPSIGATAHTTTMSVFGANFVPLAGAACVFGDAVVVPATFYNESVYTCTAGPSAAGAGAVTVKFSVDGGATLVDTGLSFTFFDMITSAIDPVEVLEGAPPVTLQVSGSGYADAPVECRFAGPDVPHGGEAFTTATFVSATRVTCDTPPLRISGAVTVEVLLDRTHLTHDANVFEYFPCPAGAYCVGMTVLICPVGHKCPGVRNDGPTACVPGTYQPLTGKDTCDPCPVGRMCPRSGMSEPDLCEEGFVCDAPGAAVPVLHCPAGYYCGPGTSTADPAATGTEVDGHPGRPVACGLSGAEAVYCPGNIIFPGAAAVEAAEGLVPSGQTEGVASAANNHSALPCLPKFQCDAAERFPQGQGACAKGYRCPTGRAIPCDPGTHAPSIGSVACDRCAAGTYQPLAGQSDCLPCPRGSVCPTAELVAPESCPAGFMCDTTGIVVAVVKCPAGSYCPGGIAGLAGDATVEASKRALPCPSGSFCSAGCMSNVPWTDAEIASLRARTTVSAELSRLLSARPQPCAAGRFCSLGAGSALGTGPCPLGFYCPLRTEVPVPAPVGHFVGQVGRAVPTSCPAGTYADVTGLRECKPCPPGYRCPVVGMVAPQTCEMGKYRGAGENEGQFCSECPVGTIDARALFPPSRPQDFGNSTPPAAAGSDRELPAGSVDFGVFGIVSEISPSLGVLWGDLVSGKHGAVVPLPLDASSAARPVDSALGILVGGGGGGGGERGDEMAYALHQWEGAENGTVSPPWWHAATLESADMCQPCPAGFACGVQGMSRLAESDLCGAGKVCPGGTTPTTSLDCPERFYCYAGTANDTATKFLCPAGRYCRTGTPPESVLDDGGLICSAGSFCPAGSSSANERPCPDRTASTAGAMSSKDCFSINRERSSLVEVTTRLGDAENDPSGLLDSRGRLLCDVMRKCRIRFDLGGPRRAGMRFKEDFRVALLAVKRREADARSGFAAAPGALPPHVERDLQRRGVLRLGPVEVLQDTGTIAREEFYRLPLPARLADDNATSDANSLEIALQPAREQLAVEVQFEVVHGRFVSNATQMLGSGLTNFSVDAPSRGGENPYSFLSVVVDANLELPLNLIAPRTTADMAPTDMDAERLDDPSDVASGLATTSAIIDDDDSPFVEEYKSLALSRSLFFTASTGAVVPYVPYVSACNGGFDSFVTLFQLLESDRCELADVDDTVFAIPWSPLTTPKGDRCNYDLRCEFEERLERREFLSRWYEAPDGTTLFYITSVPVPTEGIEDPGFNDAWATRVGTGSLVPIVLRRIGEFDTQVVPRTVTLSLKYHQVTETEKRILVGEMILEDFGNVCPEQGDTCYQNCRECRDADGNAVPGAVPDRSYRFQVSYEPLPYADLLVLMAFDIPLYVTIYFVVALFTLMTVIAFWVGHRLAYRHRFAGKLHFLTYFRLNVVPHYLALAANAVPIGLGLTLLWWVCGEFMRAALGSIPADFQLYDEGFHVPFTISRRSSEAYVVGRYAVALMTFACYVMHRGSHLLIPRRTPSLEEASSSIDHVWMRSQFMICTLLMVLAEVVIIEFSYTDVYADYIYLMIVLVFVFKILASVLLLEFLQEQLVVDAIMLGFTMCQYVTTIGASDYFLFLAAFFLTLWLDILSTLYVGRWAHKSIPRLISWVAVHVFRQPAGSGTGEEDEVDTATYDMLTYLAQASVMELALMCSPIVFFYIFLFATELRMYDVYPIPVGSLIFYFVGVLIIVATLVVGAVFLHNSQEMHHGWRIFQYLEFTVQRLSGRGTVWQRVRAQEHDHTIHPYLRALDALCFSVEYYTAVMFYAAGSVVAVFGIEMAIRTEYEADNVQKRYNAWADPVVSLIIAIVLGGCYLATIAAKKLYKLWVKYSKSRSKGKYGFDGSEADALAAAAAAIKLPSASAGTQTSVRDSLIAQGVDPDDRDLFADSDDEGELDRDDDAVNDDEGSDMDHGGFDGRGGGGGGGGGSRGGGVLSRGGGADAAFMRANRMFSDADLASVGGGASLGADGVNNLLNDLLDDGHGAPSNSAQVPAVAGNAEVAQAATTTTPPSSAPAPAEATTAAAAPAAGDAANAAAPGTADPADSAVAAADSAVAAAADSAGAAAADSAGAAAADSVVAAAPGTADPAVAVAAPGVSKTSSMAIIDRSKEEGRNFASHQEMDRARADALAKERIEERLKSRREKRQEVAAAGGGGGSGDGTSELATAAPTVAPSSSKPDLAEGKVVPDSPGVRPARATRMPSSNVAQAEADRKALLARAMRTPSSHTSKGALRMLSQGSLPSVASESTRHSSVPKEEADNTLNRLLED